MKYGFLTVLYLVSILSLGQTPGHKSLSFCTDIGAVELQFANDSIRGRYRIEVVDDRELLKHVLKMV